MKYFRLEIPIIVLGILLSVLFESFIYIIAAILHIIWNFDFNIMSWNTFLNTYHIFNEGRSKYKNIIETFIGRYKFFFN